MTSIQLLGIERLALMLFRALVTAIMNTGPACGRISGGNKSLPGDLPVLKCLIWCVSCPGTGSVCGCSQNLGGGHDSLGSLPWTPGYHVSLSCAVLECAV